MAPAVTVPQAGLRPLAAHRLRCPGGPGARAPRTHMRRAPAALQPWCTRTPGRAALRALTCTPHARGLGHAVCSRTSRRPCGEFGRDSGPTRVHGTHPRPRAHPRPEPAPARVHSLAHLHARTRTRRHTGARGVQPSRAAAGRGPFIRFRRRKTFSARRPRAPAPRRWPAGRRSRWPRWRRAPATLRRTEDHVTCQPRPGRPSSPRLPPLLISPSPAPLVPPPWSSRSCAVLSSGPGATVGAGGPVSTGSRPGLVLSTGPSPDGSSAGSFHSVGTGSCGTSSAKPTGVAGAPGDRADRDVTPYL